MPLSRLRAVAVYCFVFLAFVSTSFGQEAPRNMFQPHTYKWPAPNDCRLGSGAPGPGYWQQRADYRIQVQLDDEKQRLSGSETVTYYNNSPHTLTYLWVQLDQNLRKPDSKSNQMVEAFRYKNPEAFSYTYAPKKVFQGGVELGKVVGVDGAALKHTVVETNMRIDLPQPLAPGGKFQFSVDWAYNINNAAIEGRSGFEYFPADGNYIYEIAQFFPRMCLYDDVKGWQNKPFYGGAEFGLEFGNYQVEITAPEDHVVTATGTLQNESDVLNRKQRERLKEAREGNEKIVSIITPEEAKKNADSKKKGTKTWEFKADNVRDFAFASSRKFAWDAANVKMGDRNILAQSLYPNEGMPLWDKYSLHAVIHTLKTYSSFTFDYPYPEAIAVHGPVWGMEYPMLCFCGGRPQANGFYSRYSKYAMIGVIIHEVGHNYFPMIVNSDERRWAWMDEGLNSFLEYMTERSFEANYPHRRGPSEQFATYMGKLRQSPVMTNPESILSNSKTSYEKMTVGLRILREEIMGPEVFDMAFREYAQRWMFKHPAPADFFRTMEDASGMDLDWFWRGWFYKVYPVDMAITSVKQFKVDPDESVSIYDACRIEKPMPYKGPFYTDGKPEMEDRYTGKGTVFEPEEPLDPDLLASLLGTVPEDEKPTSHVYVIKVRNKGGCVVPIKLDLIFQDGTRDHFKLPAEIWMENDNSFRKEIRVNKPVAAFLLDPQHDLPDINRMDNLFPRPVQGEIVETHDMRK
ncbi:MAG: M1 family metallopeptidase [Bacteroidota bacterium]